VHSMSTLNFIVGAPRISGILVQLQQRSTQSRNFV